MTSTDPSSAAADPGDGWARLDPRMLAVAPAQEVVKFVPFLVVALFAGGGGSRNWVVLGALGGVIAIGMLRWFTTRYRLTPERIELRSGLLFRQHRSVPRDRVRTVDVTAKLLHRMFGLSVLQVGTGQHEPGKDGELTLNAVSSAESERLRATLLDRSPAFVPVSTDGVAAAGDGPDTQELAAISWAWLRFAPLTLLGVASIGALFGGTWQVFGELGVDADDVGAVRGMVDWFGEQSVGPVVAVVVVFLLVAGSLGALALYVEGWWGYRLTRRPDGTLRVNRGLLTRRSVSLEERRLRGAEVVEPLLLRAGRGARSTAVATGSGSGDRASLLPPAPRAEAHRVVAAVLREDTAPSLAALRRHPAAALRRRLVRTLVPAAVVVAALAVADAVDALPAWPWVAASVVLGPVAVLLGVDRYRSLGHAVLHDYLVVRSGSLLRRTVVLRRSGIIGWRVSQSLFQRTAGLATATAITAAGAGAYDLLDIEFDRAHLLGEHLVVHPDPDPDPGDHGPVVAKPGTGATTSP